MRTGSAIASGLCAIVLAGASVAAHAGGDVIDVDTQQPPVFTQPAPVAPPAVVAAPPAVLKAIPEPRAKAIDWTGSYVGGTLGYAAGNAYGTNFTNAPDVDGFIGGISTGFNWQYGLWVFGVKADFLGSTIKGDRGTSAILSAADAGALTGAAFAGPTSVNATIKSDMNWLSTVRGNVGWSWPEMASMIYVTGGPAFGDVGMHLSGAASDGVTAASFSSSETRTLYGYALGAGTETMIDQNVSLGFEYLWVDLLKQNYFGAAGGLDAGLRTHQVRFNMNWHF